LQPCSLPSTLRTAVISLFVFSRRGTHRDLHSFPTRRSSDLPEWRSGSRVRRQGRPHGHEAQRRHVFHGARRAHVFERRNDPARRDRKSTRLNSSHVKISYAVFCLKKKTTKTHRTQRSKRDAQ